MRSRQGTDPGGSRASRLSPWLTGPMVMITVATHDALVAALRSGARRVELPHRADHPGQHRVPHRLRRLPGRRPGPAGPALISRLRVLPDRLHHMVPFGGSRGALQRLNGSSWGSDTAVERRYAERPSGSGPVLSSMAGRFAKRSISCRTSGAIQRYVTAY